MAHAFAAANIKAEILVYMDDITILAHPSDMSRITQIVNSALDSIGLKVNDHKSRILSNVTTFFPVPSSAHTDPEPFILLGANISPSVEAIQKYETSFIERQEKYFSQLKQLEVHPQIAFQILRICGAPRVLYHCQVIEPSQFRNALAHFSSKVERQLSWLVDAGGTVKLPRDFIHSKHGLQFPDYQFFHRDIYDTAKRQANGQSIREMLTLTHDFDHSSYTSASLDRHWLSFVPRSHMSPAEFSVNLMILSGQASPRIRLHGFKCNCGFAYQDSNDENFEHIFRCDMSTPFTHVHRHNLVRDAVARACRAYGLSVTSEPTCFTYDDGRRRRPDLIIHTAPMKTVTDFSLVKSDANLQDEEKSKVDAHAAAVNKMGAIFIPFIMHTRGTFGTKAEEFIRTITKAIQPSLQQGFFRELRQTVASVTAQGRALSILAARDRYGW